jgi:hypothetical protein
LTYTTREHVHLGLRSRPQLVILLLPFLGQPRAPLIGRSTLQDRGSCPKVVEHLQYAIWRSAVRVYRSTLRASSRICPGAPSRGCPNGHLLRTLSVLIGPTWWFSASFVRLMLCCRASSCARFALDNRRNFQQTAQAANRVRQRRGLQNEQTICCQSSATMLVSCSSSRGHGAH